MSSFCFRFNLRIFRQVSHFVDAQIFQEFNLVNVLLLVFVFEIDYGCCLLQLEYCYCYWVVLILIILLAMLAYLCPAAPSSKD
jgi:hypothetical protein